MSHQCSVSKETHKETDSHLCTERCHDSNGKFAPLAHTREINTMSMPHQLSAHVCVQVCIIPGQWMNRSSGTNCPIMGQQHPMKMVRWWLNKLFANGYNRHPTAETNCSLTSWHWMIVLCYLSLWADGIPYSFNATCVLKLPLSCLGSLRIWSSKLDIQRNR